jgi:hypothetical protein
MNVAEIEKVHFTQDRVGFELKDGRLISVPLSFYPTLQHASEAERLKFEVSPFSVYWPGLDCDIGVEGLLAGAKEWSDYAIKSKEMRERRATKAAEADAPAMSLAEAKRRYGVP